MTEFKTYTFQSVPQPKSIFWILNDLSILDHPVKRIFFNKSYEKEIRGDHAHFNCWQTLVCLEGKIKVTLDDGKNKNTFILENKGQALTIPPKIWGTEEYEPDAYLMVLCSKVYDKKDYIQDYQIFLNAIKK